jgi:hypothetical protein
MPSEVTPYGHKTQREPAVDYEAVILGDAPPRGGQPGTLYTYA